MALVDQVSALAARIGGEFKAVRRTTAGSTRTVAANTTAVAGDALWVNASGAARTITPPTSPPAGTRVFFAKTDTSSNPVTWNGTVNGDPQGVQLAAAGAAVTLLCDGTAWWVDSVATATSSAATAEQVATVAASGSAVTLAEPSTATIHDVTLTAACAVTFPGAAAGRSFTLVLRQDATGGRTVTWPPLTRWPGGAAPSLSTAAAAIDTLSFLCVNGTHWQGFLAGKGMA